MAFNFNLNYLEQPGKTVISRINNFGCIPSYISGIRFNHKNYYI